MVRTWHYLGYDKMIGQRVKYLVDRKSIEPIALRYRDEKTVRKMQPYQECKGFLGMADYESRSYIGWHRHMLLVMVAHLFVLEVRLHMYKSASQSQIYKSRVSTEL